MDRCRRLVPLFLLVGAAALQPAAAQNTPNQNKPFFLPVNIPATDVDPSLDGAATASTEWEDGMVLPDSFFFGDAGRSGFYWFERKNDWNTSPVSDGAGITYEGITLLVAHDIVGSSDPENPLHQFQVDEDRDWNSFEFSVPTGRATIWVFDAVNDTDDSDWLPYAEGLDTSSLISEASPVFPDLIDDLVAGAPSGSPSRTRDSTRTPRTPSIMRSTRPAPTGRTTTRTTATRRRPSACGGT